MIQFTIGDVEYRAGKLNAFQQLHVSRRIACLLPKAIPALLAVTGGELDLGKALEAFGPATEALANMPAEDVDFVFGTCLSVILRKQQPGDAWTEVWGAKGNVLLFDDIDLPVMGTLVYRVLQDSLGSFMHGFLVKLHEGNSKPAAAE